MPEADGRDHGHGTGAPVDGAGAPVDGAGAPVDGAQAPVDGALESRLIEIIFGEVRDGDPLSPPIVLSTNFKRSGVGEPWEYSYTRTGNPGRDRLERALAFLEGGTSAYAFSSGLAAIAMLFRLLPARSRILVPTELYGGTDRLLRTIELPLGAEIVSADFRDLGALEREASRGAELILAESPTNPRLSVYDLRAIGAIAKKAGALFAVDNTFATPLGQRPLELGADLVVHSLTKYLGGHGDLLGGAIALKDEALGRRVLRLQRSIGAVLSPFDSFLATRSLVSFPLRFRRQAESAAEIAAGLVDHPALSELLYPGLISHPDHAIAQAQMAYFGAIITLELKGGAGAAKGLIARSRRFTLAEGLGSAESLFGHPATMSHGSMSAEARARAGIRDGHLRLSIGLEDPGDLLIDLLNALGPQS